MSTLNMSMPGPPELQKDLVFVGGGHAHALALRMLAMAPIKGLRVTLISPASHTPYSGMLPGLVGGHYSFEQAHIDLARLCQWAGVRFICAEVSAIDPLAQQLSIQGRPPVAYDVLSLDVGSEPELDSVPGARRYSVPVKPVSGLWQRWSLLRERLQTSPENTEHRIAMVGGGAGSVELIAAMAEKFSSDSQFAGQRVSFALYCGGKEILQGYNAGARKAAITALADYGIQVHPNCRVEEVQSGALSMRDGQQFAFDELFWCTGAAAMPFIANSTLQTDERGFLAIKDTLQALDYSNIFGSGDCATQVQNPRPKAGVYAVRQGPVLAHNLRNYLLDKPLKNHLPQSKFLSLLSLGAKRATADRGPFSVSGAWVWRWKDKIDREFMSRFEAFLNMKADAVSDSLLSTHGFAEVQAPCGGCGAKVGADVLSEVLGKLSLQYPDHCPATGADDAVLIPAPAGSLIVQSIDTLRQIVADPFLMGRIAANHALSDLYASGANPVSALAAISLPFSTADLLRRDLEQLLAGALHEFSAVDCALLGGHTMQGPELSVGFVVNGSCAAGASGFLGKRGMQDGDHLVMTKPLGTGTLFAGHMQQQIDGRQVHAAIQMMLQSNASASKLAIKHQVSACTDVTGFGLAGHLLEMLQAGFEAKLQLSALATLPGALQAIESGIRSSMHDANARACAVGVKVVGGADSARFDLLFDPQTSGGLLMSVSPTRSAQLCSDLIAAGYLQAAVIGEVRSTEVLEQARIEVA
ncbi:MAG: selenide,water dikinase [Halioglobus sp.]|jgi:selenide,water dikinase